MVSLELLTAPIIEPVELPLLTQHCRINTDDDKLALQMYQIAARQLFEKMTGRQLMTATYKAYFNCFHPVNQLPRPPLQSVSSVKYYDVDDVEQTLSTNNYYVDATQSPGKIFFHGSLPALSQYRSPKITVTYVCGWTTQAIVPDLVRSAICLLACHLYEQRAIIVNGIVEQIPYGFKSICDMYRIGVINWEDKSVSDNYQPRVYDSLQVGWPYMG